MRELWRSDRDPVRIAELVGSLGFLCRAYGYESAEILDPTGRVLMVAYMNEAALQQTLATGRAVFFSRTRQQLWTKGETSGHYLNVVDVSTDCDSDAICCSRTRWPYLPQWHRVMLAAAA
jgi:hypothetical protein